MAVMIAEVFDALKEAGASDDKARKAAEVLAAYDARFAKIETDLQVLKWMTGTTLAGMIAVLVRLFGQT